MNTKKRDKFLSRRIHKLFWTAQFQDKPTLVISYLCRIPAVAAYNIFIPLVTAQAVQAIIERNTEQLYNSV